MERFSIVVETTRHMDERYWLMAGDRPFPVSTWVRKNLEEEPFMADFLLTRPTWRHRERHAWVPFENVWSLSVTWGDLTYSDNRVHYLSTEPQPFVEEPVTVEVGVLAPEGLWGNPFSMVTVPDFIRIAAAVATLPSEGWDYPAPDEWGYSDEDDRELGTPVEHFEQTVTLGLLALSMKGTQ